MGGELEPFVGLLLRLATYLHILFSTDFQINPQEPRKHCGSESSTAPRSYHFADSLIRILSSK